MKIPLGLCQCGCGEKTKIATRTRTQWGHVKGEPLKFISGGHAGRNPNAVTRMPEYRVYLGAKARCTNPKHVAWDYYGGRGIKFLFTSFEEFYAELGARPSEKHTVDRIDNDKHYEKGNVKWSTRAEQSGNRRHYTHKIRHGKGVYWNKHAEKWTVQIWYMGIPTYLGLFSTKKEAIDVRDKALKERGL